MGRLLRCVRSRAPMTSRGGSCIPPGTRRSRRSRGTDRSSRPSSASRPPGGMSSRWPTTRGTPTTSPSGSKIPIPRSSTPGSIDAFDPVAEPGPWAIKPAIKERFIYETKKKAWRADDEGQLRDAFRRAAEIVGPDEVIIQELIPGDGRHQVAFCALCDQGRTVAEMTVRRLRQHPPEFGRASTFAESVDLPEVATSARRFLQAMRCHGLVEVEFKLDPRDGRYKLLDVNARTWGYHTLGCARRCRFPLPPVSISDRTTGPFDARTGGSGLGPSPDGRSDRPR